MLKKREERNNKAFQKLIKKNNNKSKQELKDRIQEKKVQQV